MPKKVMEKCWRSQGNLATSPDTHWYPVRANNQAEGKEAPLQSSDGYSVHLFDLICALFIALRDSGLRDSKPV